MRWTREDSLGFLIAAALTTGPLLAVTCFLEFLSKDGPIGLPAYLIPTAVGLSAAALISVGGRLAGRGSSGPARPEYYLAYGSVASLSLLISYCALWGEWSFRFAEQFRR